jgi:DNA-binding NarL/FixJ family response regulator
LSERIRILLVDDHAVVRAGVRALLQDSPDIEIIGEAADGAAAVDLAREHRPDVVIMDIAMPHLNGLEAAARIKEDNPAVKLVILSMHDSREYVLQALKAGASAYVMKDSAPVELDLALAAVRRGDTYLSPAVSKQVIRDYLAGANRQPDTPLTPRQREVLVLIAQGMSTKKVAHQLNVSVKTVETHRAQLMERLGISDIAGLVRYAIRTGLVDLSDD